MALVLADRVQETTVTTGTGTITLAGAVTGFQTFAVVGNGNTTYYTLVSGSNWESGVGTYSTSGPTLARTTILSSSNADSAITLSGTSTVFLTGPSSRSVLRNESNILTLNAGTATVPPLDFQSGTNLTSAIEGAVEYDGKVFYATPQGTQRGVVPGMQYYRLNADRALASSTAAQSLLGVGVTLSSSTVYAFQAILPLQKTTTTTSHTFGLGFGGTAVVASIGYYVVRTFDTTASYATTSTINGGFITSASNTTLIGASTSATNFQNVQLNGVVSITTGGTFIPQLTVSATGPIYTVLANSNFLIYPIGAAGANTSVGTWA